MTILHICSIDNNKCNGISNVVPTYILTQKKYIDVALVNCNSIKIEALESEKSSVFYYSKNNNFFKILPDKYKNPSLVIFHGIYFYKYISIYKNLIKKNIPYLIVPHGSLTKYAQKHKRVKKTLGNLILFNKFISNSRCIQYLSNNEKSNTTLKNKKSIVINGGISDIPNKNLYINKKKNEFLKFVYIGRYEYYIKGIDIIINVAKYLKKNNYKIKFYLYGKGSKSDLKRINKEIKKNSLESIINVNGPVYNEEKIKKMLECDVFIQLSRTEGMPRGIMEAMSYGMPLLISEGTGFSEIVDQNNVGLVINSSNSDIIEKIKMIYNDRSILETFSDNSYNTSKKIFNEDNQTKKTIEEYKKIIGGN